MPAEVKPINPSHLSFENVVARPSQEAALTPLHLLVVLSLALASLVWGAVFILGGQGLQSQRYLALLGVYGVSSAAFVTARIRRAKLQLFEIPVYITALFFLQFGLVPLSNFIDPEQISVHLSADGRELVEALSYVMLGMMVFWVGCELARPKVGSENGARQGAQSIVPGSNKARALMPFGALYAIGFITKVYLLKTHLYSYLASGDVASNLASLQVLTNISQFGTLALIIAAIERYCDRKDPLWKVLFIVAFATEIFWGLISGMKAQVLHNFLAVAIVSSFIKRKLNLGWIFILFFALVLIYPLMNAYRMAVHRDGTTITSFGDAAKAGQMAFSTVQEDSSSTGDLWREGLHDTQQRLDLLTSVAEVLTLGSRASMVKGDLSWWMLPIYPFVPRFLWPSKPILDESGRFTFALGGDLRSAATMGISSTAITYPGDLYLQFGLPGMLGGMFLLGIIAQWFTNRVSGEVGTRDLFVYIAVFLFGFKYETDAFSMLTGLIKLVAVLYILRLLIYGAGTPRRRLATVFSVRAPRP